MIQKLGFSREAALYILAHESDYVVIVDGELKLKSDYVPDPGKKV